MRQQMQCELRIEDERKEKTYYKNLLREKM